MATTFKGTTQTGAGNQTNPAFSSTMMQARTVWEKIPLNYAQNLKLLALLADGEVDGQGLVQKPGYISKWQVGTPRFESFNYDPLPISTFATADMAAGATTLYCDTTYAKAGQLIRNISNGNPMVARIDSVTSSTVMEVTSIGDTAFAVTNGDELMYLASAWPENSSGITLMSKDYDNVYNTLQIVREPVGISNSMLKSQFLAGGSDYFKLLKENNLIEMLRKTERNLILGARAASTSNTTAGGAALTASFRTTRGWYDWAAQVYDMKGNCTLQKLMTDIPSLLYTVKETEDLICFGGYKSFGIINELINGQARYIVDSTNERKSAARKLGIVTTSINTLNMPIDLVKHEVFNTGAMANQMMLVVPDNLRVPYLKDRDIRPVTGLQNNDVDGMIDSVEAELGAGVIDGGIKILIVKNMW
jgi:hypothetical protein